MVLIMPTPTRSGHRRSTHLDLIELRVNDGLSRAALALRAGIGRETVRLAECGFVPTPRVQYAIAKALKRTPLDLWPIEVQPRPRVAA